MTSMDVFGNSVFSMVSLTNSINHLPFVPGKVGRLGIFTERGIATTTALIEEYNGVLTLIATTPRGAPAVKNASNKRGMRSLIVPHIAMEDTIYADQVQNVRAFGSESELQGVQQVVNDRLASIASKMDATLEHLRLSAVQGQVLDADGTTVLLDLNTAFGTTAQATTHFNFSLSDGSVRTTCSLVIRKIEDELGAAPYEHIHCLCSAAFWDSLIACPEVRATYLQTQAAADLRDRSARTDRSFSYGGITFEEYRGKVGAIDFITAGNAHIFPVGVPELFMNYFGPADFVETVNTIGLPRYAKQAVDTKYQRWVEVHAQTNPLPICTRPRTLMLAQNS